MTIYSDNDSVTVWPDGDGDGPLIILRYGLGILYPSNFWSIPFLEFGIYWMN